MLSFEDIRVSLKWFSSLSKTVMTIVYVSATIISVLSVFVYFQNKMIEAGGNESIDVFKSEIAIVKQQVSNLDTISRHYWADIKREQQSTKKDIENLTIITAANSNSELFRQLVPYLNNIEENTYKTIIYLQKQEILKRLDSTSISVRKIKKQ